jgi:outer membrane immunogenic protein
MDVSAPYDWSGFYAGGHIAQSWIDGNYYVDPVGNFGIGAEAFRFGVLGGYNHLTENMLVGIEADVSLGEADDSFSVIGDFEIGPEVSLRFRVGLPQDRLLPYVTLGAALASAKSGDIALGNDTALHLGLAAGAGLEFALTDAIALRGEYLFESFGKATYEFADRFTNFDDTAGWDEHILRTGVTYKFNR